MPKLNKDYAIVENTVEAYMSASAGASSCPACSNCRSDNWQPQYQAQISTH